jgi:hypothetical protein
MATHSFYLEDFGSSSLSAYPVELAAGGVLAKEGSVLSGGGVSSPCGNSSHGNSTESFLTVEKNECDLIYSRKPPELLVPALLKVSQIVIPPRLLDVAARDYFMDFISADSPVRQCASPLALVAKCSIDSLGLGAVFESFDAEERWLKFAAQIEAGYPERGYHCRLHAADVTNRLAALMSRTGICNTAGTADNVNDSTRSVNDNPSSQASRWMTAALVAAMVHDYDHPQLSNQYLVAMVRSSPYVEQV